VHLPEVTRAPQRWIITIPIFRECAPSTDEHYFLPRRALEGPDKREPPARDFMNRGLTALREPSLSCGRDPDEGFRLVSIDPEGSRWFVRISRKGSSYDLAAAQLPDDPSDLSEVGRVNKSLSRLEWESVTREFQRADFWSLNASRDLPYIPEGSLWLFEGRQDGKYHAVMRMPYEGKELRSAVRLLIKLAGLEIPLYRYFGISD
jgi:hypothetical protein